MTWIGVVMRRPAVVTVTSVAPAASGQKTPRGSSTTCPPASRMISGRPRTASAAPRRAATNRAIRGFDEREREVGRHRAVARRRPQHALVSGRKTPVYALAGSSAPSRRSRAQEPQRRAGRCAVTPSGCAKPTGNVRCEGRARRPRPAAPPSRSRAPRRCAGSKRPTATSSISSAALVWRVNSLSSKLVVEPLVDARAARSRASRLEDGERSAAPADATSVRLSTPPKCGSSGIVDPGRRHVRGRVAGEQRELLVGVVGARHALRAVQRGAADDDHGDAAVARARP